MVVGEFKLYHYEPSLAAALTASICFGIATLVHFIYFIVKRTWFFTPFIIGGIFETLGYVGRLRSSQQTPNWTTGPYIMQTLLLLLAPALFAASIYMILGRIIQLTDGDSRSVIRGRWITRIFVIGDVVSFLAQAGGGGILAKADSNGKQDLGNDIIIGGLLVQIVFFGLFIIVSAIFHVRMVKWPTPRAVEVNVPWQRLLFVLYVANTFILLRSLFRVVEYVQGTEGPLQANECWLYIFDGLLMFLMMLLLVVYHPSRIIISYAKINSAEEWLMEMSGGKGWKHGGT
ncbi:RTA1-domain-containing protein [Aspergillus floccosus]